MAMAIDVELARLVLVSPNLVVVNLKPEVKITVHRVLEIMHARRVLVSGVPVGMYVIAPGEPDWESDALGMDFFSPEAERIKALALMVSGPIFSAVANLYLGLFPGRCPVKVVNDLDEGYAWLAEQGFAIAKS